VSTAARAAVERRIRQALSASDAEAAIDALEPSIRVRAHRSEDLPLGASRIGGAPDVPRGFAWPSWRARRTTFTATLEQVEGEPEEIPLAFIAQIRLADLAPFEVASRLPRSGWLLFFFDADTQPWGFEPTHAGGARVVHVEAPADSLVRTAGGSADFTSSACAVTFHPSWTLPEEIPAAITSLAAKDAYVDVRGELDGLDPAVVHRMFGEADAIQGDMRLETELVTNGLSCGDATAYADPRRPMFEARKSEWQLLLQIDSDEEGPGWMWGDAGRIYFWIRRADLHAARFDRTWTILQCG
jgi:uncharacterized protein YwqG